MTKKIVLLLNNSGLKINHALEKVHIITGIIDNLCHEIVYHKHTGIDYNIMKDKVIEIVVGILK